jgi:hypothetical protein
MTLAQIHEKSRMFQRRIRGRNMREFIACAIVVLGFLPALFNGGNWMMKAGGGLIIAATLFVAWQLHRRGSAEVGPESGEALTEFYRAQLTRQRAAARSIALWYITPFVPGMTLLLCGLWRLPHAKHALILLTAILFVIVNAGIWMLNQYAARVLQKRLDELPPPRP